MVLMDVGEGGGGARRSRCEPAPLQHPIPLLSTQQIQHETHIKVLPKSAEKESGPGQPCMTNPSLTPSVPLSASKDKSCIERKR